MAAIAICCAFGAVGAASPASTLPRCKAAQLRLRAGFQGATQSLLGTAVLTNPSARACALPVAPSRVTLVIGKQVLPALTVRVGTQGVSTRRLPGHGRVLVRIQWRNWCGAPRGKVHLSLGLTIYDSETRRVSVGLVRTPVCVDHKYSSRVAVSPFIKP
jgi:Protein of unknown function (DUF4232)